MRGACTANTGPLPLPPPAVVGRPPAVTEHRHLRDAIAHARRKGLGGVAIDLELQTLDVGVVRRPIDERLDALLAQRELLHEAMHRELLGLEEAPAAQVEDSDRLGDVEHRM